MNVSVIFVLYKPNIDEFYKTLDSIKNQVNHLIIVVNENAEYNFSNYSNSVQISLGKNFGIAYAQNRGIEKAISLSSDYILLSEQDTVYPTNYISSFIPYIQKNYADVYCPVFYDKVKNTYSPIMVGKFKAIYKYDEPIYVEHAIASGTLIKSDIFKETGLMDEKLFIDYVDFEWCWRIVSKKKKIITIPSIIINHQLGDGVKKIGLWKVTLRSDFRYFYIIRNGFYLSFYCEYLNKYERKHLLLRTLKFCIGIILLKHNLTGIKLCKNAYEDAKKKNFDGYKA